MSEAKPNPNTSRVEGELSLDDLSQIAGGTASELQLSQLSEGANFNFGGGADPLKPSDNMFGIQVDTSEYNVAPSMNMSLAFP